MIYYVEDDTNIRDLTVYALKQAGFEAAGFTCGRDFFKACDEKAPDLVLLDIMLPEMDGLEILRELRSLPSTKNIPVMMLTAKGTEFDKVCGLDAGADDYLAKPFGMMELVSRVNALLRRAQAPAVSADMTVPKTNRTISVKVSTLRKMRFDRLFTLLWVGLMMRPSSCIRRRERCG